MSIFISIIRCICTIISFYSINRCIKFIIAFINGTNRLTRFIANLTTEIIPVTKAGTCFSFSQYFLNNKPNDDLPVHYR